ncbi:FAD/NAD(P)-binding oxidoreductase [Flavobacterium sp. Arc3]|uniref:NAD(P)/FAD-dependent oxidoreductase n=1 Tax=Flavobacterium sp. Arc3 TaxID=3046686 RepID=UPI00352ECA11
MQEHFQILIIGGGNAGLSVTSQLLRKKSDLKIGIIEPSEKHYYQPAWTLVGAGIYDINKTRRKEKDYIPKNSTWIIDSVTEFMPAENKVICQSGKEISYQYLVVSPGIQLDWDKIKGLKETLGKNNVSSNYSFEFAPKTWEFIENFKGGTAVFTNPSTPIKCGGAPHKIMYLACDYWRKKGIMDKCDVHYISGGAGIFGVPEYAETLKEVLQKYKIHTHFGANVTAIDGAAKTVEYETKDTDETIKQSLSTIDASCYAIATNDDKAETKTVSIQFDLCHVVPPQSAPDFIKKSPLADPNSPLGFVEVDKFTLQHSRFPNVFALGDCINAPASKTGAAIRKQAPVVVDNLLSVIQGKAPSKKYDGYSACPIPTEYGKLMLAEFDYDNKPKMTFPFDQAKPRWSMWILKTKILPWLYWNKILKGTA